MTSVLMIFEMTQAYAVIVPLAIANLVSLFISSRLQRQPIYDALALQEGYTCLRQQRITGIISAR
jgi:CIC family chloride channel protein